MSLKNLLPFENYVLATRLSKEDLLKRIAANIRSHKAYSGKITGESFTMTRNIAYRNSFLPIIEGNVTTEFGQTRVAIKMRLNLFVLIFMSIWLGIVGLVSIGLLLAIIVGFRQIIQNGFPPMLLIPFGMFVFGSLLMYFAFKTESSKSKKFLAALIESIDD